MLLCSSNEAHEPKTQRRHEGSHDGNSVADADTPTRELRERKRYAGDGDGDGGVLGRCVGEDRDEGFGDALVHMAFVVCRQEGVGERGSKRTGGDEEGRRGHATAVANGRQDEPSMHPKERAEPDDNGGEGVSWRKAAFRSKRQPATRTCPSACRGAEALDGLQVRRYEEHHGHLAGHAAHVCDVAGQQVAAEDDVPGGVIFISTERMGVGAGVEARQEGYDGEDEGQGAEEANLADPAVFKGGVPGRGRNMSRRKRSGIRGHGS
ncbi:hypothetical protein CCMA1212_002917 [Trichoderma ghanense]|uniref:Uncharacterized protein n=1 Tax=Trichoderma ghanense TaxID=65468 RepID=A0ABY2HAA8_9HYPO